MILVNISVDITLQCVTLLCYWRINWWWWWCISTWTGVCWFKQTWL